MSVRAAPAARFGKGHGPMAVYAKKKTATQTNIPGALASGS